MKGFGMLLLYFFTWRSVIIGSVFAGGALLALALTLAAMAPAGASVATGLAFVLLLALPYMFSPKALRTIISNRRLAIVPGLPLRTGLVMLLFTIVTAAFLPCMAWLLGAPAEVLWLAPRIFIVASLYSLITQKLVTSPYMWIHVQWMPIAVFVFVTLFGDQLWMLAANRSLTAFVAGLAFTGWLYVLVVLTTRRNFKAAYVKDMQTADRETIMFMASWFSRKTQQRVSSTSSLLLGYPASTLSRAVNIVYLLIVSPLLSVALVEFMVRMNGEEARVFTATELFLAMSLLTSFITSAISWAETGPRARLLWLRVPGSRARVWETMEKDLWVYFKLLLAVTAVIAATITLYGGASMLLVHFVLTLFTLTFYQRYLPLAARLNGWSSLTQALVLIASIAAMAFTVVYSLRVANFNVAFLLELCLLLMGVVFRALAKFGFNRVDWQVVRPAPSRHAGAPA